ncbi:MAG: hypothetical protein QM598_07560 [Protaetiibacter sp.]
MRGPLRVGAARIEVTPSRPGALAGYIARGAARADAALDPLEAAALAIDDGHTAMIWIALDAVAVTEHLAAEAARIGRGVAGRELPVVLAASHTHSGPAHWLGEFAPGHGAELDADAVAELLRRIERVVGEAWNGLAPVRASWHEPRVSGLASRRAYADAPVDVTAGTLVVRDDRGVTAILVDVPCHATVLGPENTRWSADWPGALRRALRARHPNAVVVFLNGASGDLSTRFTRKAATSAEVERLGARVADAVLEVVDEEAPVAPVLATRSVRLSLPSARRDPGAARERLTAAADARAGADEGHAAVLQSVLDGARIELAVAERVTPDPLDVEARIVRLGHVTWVAMPFEVFSSTARTLAAEREALRIVSCAGPYEGYLPDDDAFADDTYEARTARVSRAAEPRARAQLRAALADLDRIHPPSELS